MSKKHSAFFKNVFDAKSLKMGLMLSVPLILAACQTTGSSMSNASTELPNAGSTWQITQLNGQPVQASRIVLKWEDGRISGSDGCNRLMGSYTVDNQKITFGPIAGTKMACDPTVMKLANEYTSTLQKTAYTVANQQTLALLDENKKVLATFSKLPD